MNEVKHIGLVLLFALNSPFLFATDMRVQEPKTAAPEYGLTIRSTPHRSPSEEKAGFHLPEGFQIDLIASEPTIKKPLNIAFDRKGRLWVTQTTHYPFPAKEAETKTDSIAVLEDRDGDGTFETNTIFADELNIPIGIIPTDDGAICFSIPHIWKLHDTDSDGKCDDRSILYGPFDTSRDTHGMVNSLRDGNDGWIYACHGFNNQSTVSGKDGHTVSMTSGNVFRFRADGSRIELFTQGQVNPFGMTQDEWGNWFSADCHSKPITQLVHGGCYPSFGRPDDGLGFVPSTMEHLHGSTAIAGLAHTKDSNFPTSMRGQLLSGNVMTCRINRNQLQYHGATAKAIEQTDLLTSEDSWFRPVDLCFGPDGHLYIADFYNKVIGHYEVPLDHPDRDRTSGRLWRIRSVRDGDRIEKYVESKFMPSDDTSNTASAIRSMKEFEALAARSDLQSLGSMLQRIDQSIAAQDDPILVQSYVISLRRMVQNTVESNPEAASLILNSLSVEPHTSPKYAMLLTVLLATKNSKCHSIGLELLTRQLPWLRSASSADRASWDLALERLIDVADEQNVERTIHLLEQQKTLGEKESNSYPTRLLGLVQRQFQSRGHLDKPLAAAASKTANELIQTWFQKHAVDSRPINDWIINTHGKRDDRREWGIEKRQRQSPNNENESSTLEMVSSFPLGENYRGSMSTGLLPAPEKWSFYIAGHNGLPKEADHRKSFARMMLVDLASGETKELYRSYPPRSDVARRVEWDLSVNVGSPVFFEVVDGDSAASYAWIAVGGFSDEGLAMNARRSEFALIQSYLSLLGVQDSWELKNGDQTSPMRQWAESPLLSKISKLRLWKKDWLERQPMDAEILAYAMETQQWDLASRFFWDTTESIQLRYADAFSIWNQQYSLLFRRWSSVEQSKLVLRISKYRGAPERLASWIESNTLSPDVVSTLPASWWGGLSKADSERLAPIRSLAEKKSNRAASVEAKLVAIREAKVDLELGKRVYTEKCSLCHKLGTVGNVLGPQLEGIGNRGMERLCEDILWPDRNVDDAFRMTLILLEGGETVTGLVLERTDQSITIAEQNGNKRVISISDVEQEKKSQVSLMPGNFDEVLANDELASLVEYLRSEVSKAKGK